MLNFFFSHSWLVFLRARYFGYLSDICSMFCQVRTYPQPYVSRVVLIYETVATYSTHPFLNIGFAIFFSLTTYFYFYSMVADPGYVPKLGSRNQQKSVVSELFDEWKFDEENFCVYCMIRRPLRSKHCKRCSRCVAKHDQ